MNTNRHCKILLFAASFPPPGGGGSVQYIFNIFEHLPRDTATIQTANTDPVNSKELDVSFPQKIIRRNFIIQVLMGHTVKKLARFLGYFQWPIAAFLLVLRERPDVIHIGEHNYSFIAALFAKRWLKIPYVLYTYAEEITYLTTRPLHFKFFLLSVRNASAVITVSEYTKEMLLRFKVKEERITKILPSVSKNKKAIPSRALIDFTRDKYNLNNKKVLLTVARLEERKGHLSVIESLPQILLSFPDVIYVVAGTGSYETLLRQHVEISKLADNVIFTGYIADSEISALYEICDLFIMPHRQLSDTLDTEGCPTVFLEASAHGKPVIGGNAGGVADAILDGKTGFIIDGTDAFQIAEKVILLLQNKTLSRMMGSFGRKYVQALTPENNASIIYNLNKLLVSDAML
jgi:phosphatidylinositol alpha-1,6-mannosyltransferase